MDVKYLSRFFILIFGVLFSTYANSAGMDGTIVTGATAPNFTTSQSAINLADAHAPTAITLEQLSATQDDLLKSGLTNTDKGSPQRVGINRPLSELNKRLISPQNLSWRKATGKKLIASISITSPEALSIRAGISLKGISELGIAKKIKLRFFGLSNNTVYGQYHLNKLIKKASEHDKENMMYWSPIIEGNLIGIEIEVPDDIDVKKIPLNISNISHLALSQYTKGIGDSGSCNVDAVCNSDYSSNIAKTSAKIIFTKPDGTYSCSGTILNDADSTSYIPYFYTADHCIPDQATAATVQTILFFARSQCGSGTPDSVHTLTGGADYLWGSSNNDATLLRLADSLPNGVGLAGWTTDSVVTSAIGIHHPSGDVRKISLGTRTQITDYSSNTQDGNASYHKVIWSSGTTEPGSSGSGLFNNSRRLVGSLRGGAASCSNSSAPDWYGRFDLSYASISQWINAEASAGDDYEDDDTASNAKTILPGVTQTHSIHDLGDLDWMTFTLAVETEVRIETSATGSSTGNNDTVMYLYRSSDLTTAYGYNDDGGIGLYSKIETTLAAGTYYIRISEFGLDGTIDSYNIDLTTDTSDSSPITISGADVAAQPGETLEMPIYIGSNTGANGAVALQMDVLFDHSKVRVTGESHGPDFGSIITSGNLVSNGVYRIILADTSSNLLNNGHVLNLNIDVLSSTPQGSVPITFSSIVIADASGNGLSPANVTPGAVIVSSISSINLLVGSSNGASGSSVTLPVSLDNNDEISAGQFDITWDNNLFTLNNFSTSTASAVTVTGNITPGKLRIVFADFSGNTVSDGVLLNMTFNIPSTTVDGSYNVAMSNIQLANNSGNLLSPSNVSSGLITVTSLIPGDANGDGIINIQDVVAIINMILNTSADTLGADINGDGIVNIQDVVAVINIILNP